MIKMREYEEQKKINIKVKKKALLSKSLLPGN